VPPFKAKLSLTDHRCSFRLISAGRRDQRDNPEFAYRGSWRFQHDIPRGPTADETQASVENAAIAPRFGKKGIYCYRTHAEANEAAERWIVQAMVDRQRHLRQGTDRRQHPSILRRLLMWQRWV
jgi:hypothetical protein